MVPLCQPQTHPNFLNTSKKPLTSAAKGVRDVDATLRMRILETYSSCAAENEQQVSKMLSRITGQSIAEEARTPTANILTNMRDCRWNWLGHILRYDEDKLVRESTCNCIMPEKEASFGDIPNLPLM